jgi:hypothetical protein
VESIDQELRKQLESFLNTAVRTLKQGMQNLATELQVNIGFLFEKLDKFNTGLAALETMDPSWQNICGKPAPGPNVC